MVLGFACVLSLCKFDGSEIVFYFLVFLKLHACDVGYYIVVMMGVIMKEMDLVM